MNILKARTTFDIYTQLFGQLVLVHMHGEETKDFLITFFFIYNYTWHGNHNHNQMSRLFQDLQELIYQVTNHLVKDIITEVAKLVIDQ